MTSPFRLSMMPSQLTAPFMSELTKEYFEQKLEAQTTDLKAHAEGLQAELARMVSGGFEDLQHRLDVREIVQAHERKLKKIEEALHITL